MNLSGSDLSLKRDNLILTSNVDYVIQDIDKFYTFIQTPKKARKKIKNISMIIELNLSNDKININKLSIDGIEPPQKVIDALNNFNKLENNISKNKIINRIFINKLFLLYEG